LGALGYSSGYLSYSNPYYDSSNSFGNYNYAQPIPVAYDAPAQAANTGTAADGALNAAVAAFKKNDYAAALSIADKGIAQFPDDSVLYEFRALSLFAEGNYQPAAATIHSLLAVGPGWDWATLSSMYSDVAVYTGQLRKLEAFVSAHPQDGASRFLLAYQYLSCGNVDAAERQLAKVVKIVPTDRVAVDMLKMASTSKDGRPAETVVAAKPVAPASGESNPNAAPVDPATLMGTWRAARDDGSMFELTLGKDSTFDWKFTPKGQKVQDFGGTYTVEKNVLALQRKNGGSLIAEVTPGSGKDFNFKLVGGPADDPGLAFNR
jgi:tetratricopeptide (TPR) repeat protein